MVVSVSIYILFFVVESTLVQVIGTVGLVVLIVAWLYFEYYLRTKNRKVRVTEDAPIKRFILMSPDGNREKEWHCEGMASFLIGKGMVNKNVDIELGDTHYADYITNEHAVLNCVEGVWYIEDLGNSINGVGIRKRGDEYTLRLKPSVSYKVDEGDIIYISKAKILVR